MKRKFSSGYIYIFDCVAYANLEEWRRQIPATTVLDNLFTHISNTSYFSLHPRQLSYHFAIRSESRSRTDGPATCVGTFHSRRCEMTPNHREANVTRWIDGSVGQSGDESSSGSSVALEYRTAAASSLPGYAAKGRGMPVPLVCIIINHRCSL